MKLQRFRSGSSRGKIVFFHLPSFEGFLLLILFVFLPVMVLGAGKPSSIAVDEQTKIIEGRSYPVAAKAAARVIRAREYRDNGLHDESARDCKAVLDIEDRVYYMNPEDLKAIREAKKEARQLLSALKGGSGKP